MKEELSYVLVTPYTISKSRTGGVISRLLSRVDLEFVGAQIFDPSKELAEQYAASLKRTVSPDDEKAGKLLSDYVLNCFVPSNTRKPRVLMLLFRGKDACRKLSDITGAIHKENMGLESITGETIRDTYADIIMSKDDPEKVQHFEPAVLTPRNQKDADFNMKLFADYLKTQSPVINNLKYKNQDKVERTLVIIKPDNWMYASSRPGTIIDMFSRTGLRIISTKVQQMSVAQALEFYGPVKDVLKEKLAPVFGKKAKETLEEKFSIVLSDKTLKSLSDSFGVEYAVDQFNQIVEFMSGSNPDKCPLEELDNPGKVKSMVLIYEGENAVSKIRDVLGPTDPTKAPGGTIRREFGSNIMVNTAHASDSPENAKREMGIIRIEENNCYNLISSYLK